MARAASIKRTWEGVLLWTLLLVQVLTWARKSSLPSFLETLCRSRLVLVGRGTRVYYVPSLFAYRCVDNGHTFEDMSDVGTFVSLTTIPC